MRIIEFFHEVALPVDAVWRAFSDVGRWPAFDQRLTEVHTEGYEPSYVTFTPSFYVWRRMRLEQFPDEGKLVMTGRLPLTRVRTSFSVRKSRQGALVHCRIRFAGGLSLLWAPILMLPYRRRVQGFVNAWLGKVAESESSIPATSASPLGNLRIDSAHDVASPLSSSIHELAQPD